MFLTTILIIEITKSCPLVFYFIILTVNLLKCDSDSELRGNVKIFLLVETVLETQTSLKNKLTNQILTCLQIWSFQQCLAPLASP